MDTNGKVRLMEGMGRSLAAARRDKTPQRFFGDVRQAFEDREITFDDLSLPLLFETFVPHGREMLRMWQLGGFQESVAIGESDAVKTSDFSKILLHALSSEVMQEYQRTDLMQDRLCRTIKTRFELERIPGIGGIGDVAEAVGEGEPYPKAGVNADWIDTPPTAKRGFIVPVSKEAIFFDRTGVIRDRCSKAAEWLRVNKEKRMISVVAGVVNNWKYMDAAHNTYQNGGGGELFDNTAGSNAFANWKNVQAAELLIGRMRDPQTGEPIMLGGERVAIGSPDHEWPMRMVFGAKEVRELTSSNATITLSNNPATGYTHMTSALFRDIIGDSTTWMFGDPKRAFVYMENWGITPQTAGEDSSKGFEEDIVMQFKVSERGAAGVENPRYMIKNTA